MSDEVIMFLVVPALIALLGLICPKLFEEKI